MATEYLYFQSIVQYRVDKATGKVEYVKGFTTPFNGLQRNKAPKQKTLPMTTEQNAEVEFL